MLLHACINKERFKANELSFYLKKPERKTNQMQRKKEVTKRKKGNKKGKDRSL